MNVNMEEGWTEVSHRKKEEISKPRENDVESTYVLSELIQNEACIHCMVGKCRERKDHSSIYFPDKIMGYIRNPLSIKTLDETLKRNPLELEVLKPYQVRYSVCMFNHCRKACKNCRANRFTSIDMGDDSVLYVCYPSLDRITRNTVTVGLHIDMQLNFVGNRHDVVWRTKHNEIPDDIETESISSPISSNASPMVENGNKWASVVKRNLSAEELESFAMNDEESSKYMIDTEYVQRRVMNSPTEREQSSPMNQDRRRPPPRRNNEFEGECMYRFEVLLKEIQNIKDQNTDLTEKVVSLHETISSLNRTIFSLHEEVSSMKNADTSSSTKKYITW